MLAVPLGVHGRVAQAEVRAQVDHPDAALVQVGHELGRRAVRVGDDRRLQPLGLAVQVERLEHQRHAVVGIELVQAAAGVGASGNRPQLELRMPKQQARG